MGGQISNNSHLQPTNKTNYCNPTNIHNWDNNTINHSYSNSALNCYIHINKYENGEQKLSMWQINKSERNPSGVWKAEVQLVC